MRYVMRIAKSVSHQNFERNLHFLRGVCLLECLFPTQPLPRENNTTRRERRPFTSFLVWLFLWEGKTVSERSLRCGSVWILHVSDFSVSADEKKSNNLLE